MVPTEGDLVRALLDAAPAGAALVAPDGTVSHWNATAEELTGWPAAEMLGRRDLSLPPEDQETTREVLEDWIAHPDHAERRVVRRLRPDGVVMHLVVESVRAVPMGDGNGLAVWFTAASDVDTLLLQRNRLSRRLVSATRIDEVLPVLTGAVRELLGAPSAIVLRRCPSGERDRHR